MKPTLVFLFLFLSFSISAQISETNYSILRKSLTQKINQLRISKELKALESNVILQKTAKNHSVYMAKKKRLGHGQVGGKLSTPMKRVRFFKGEVFQLVGENVLHSAPVSLPLKKNTLEALAEKMFLSWKNSPEHYANMINPDYEFGDIAFQLDPSDKIVYATQVFGRKGVKIEGQFSDDAFGLTEVEGFCESAYGNYDNLIANMGNSIHLEGNRVMFYYYSLDYFNLIFSGDLDGIAIDLVFRDQVKCGVRNRIDYSPIYDGLLLKPVYKNEILRNNEATSSYRIISQIATIPDSLLSKEFSCSVVLLKNRKKCKYLVPGDVPRKRYDLKPIEPKLSNPTSVRLKKKGIVHSQELRYDFQTNITTPIKYPVVEKIDYRIHSVDITSFSSVEGDQNENAILHNGRAQSIQKHLQNKLKIKEAKISIDAKENWDKMYFQLNYFLANELAVLSKDSLKNILASEDESLAWDSLLFNQRKSIATIHYEGLLSDTSNLEKLLTMNLKTAIATKNFDLANKALFEMYQANFFPSTLLFEESVFKAILNYPELTQNVAAIFSKSYKKDLSKTIEFLFRWMNRSEDLSEESKFNLLHLYTLISFELLNNWDLPAKRLSNVVNPFTVKKLMIENIKSELVLNLNLTFIRYFGQINDSRNISKSFDYIADYFRSRVLQIEDEIDLVLFFNNWSRYDLTNKNLLAKYKEEALNEEAIFILMQTMTFYTDEDGEDVTDIYEDVYLEAFELNQKKWCVWVNDNFQILRDQKIKNLFCTNCAN